MYIRAFLRFLPQHFTHCPDEEGTEIAILPSVRPASSALTSLIAPMRRGLKF